MNDNLAQDINLETAKIRWHELQRFFAGGNAVAVDVTLDLTQVAAQIVADNATQIKEWMTLGFIDTVSDSQAQQWHTDDVWVWAVVIKPWVLVQPVLTEKS